MMTTPAASVVKRHQISRLVWTLSAVGCCCVTLMLVISVGSVGALSRDYARLREAESQTDAIVNRIESLEDIAFVEIYAMLTDDHGDQGATAVRSGPSYEQHLSESLEGLAGVAVSVAAKGDQVDLIRRSFVELDAIASQAAKNQVEAARVGEQLDARWRAFESGLTSFRARVDKAQGRARLELQAADRGGSPAGERLAELAYTSDIVRSLTVELGDLELAAGRLRWESDPELLRSLRDNTLTQTRERLDWVAHRLPDELRPDAVWTTGSLVGLLFDPTRVEATSGASPGDGRVYELKAAELRLDAETRSLVGRLEDIRSELNSAEQEFHADVRAALERESSRASATYRSLWWGSLILGTGMLLSFLALSVRIARVGTRTELELLSKNTELEAATSSLGSLARTDALTGLVNRRLFVERLEERIERRHLQSSNFAVIFFDIDRFKIVNDSLGHEVGDGLLKKAAEIFQRELRPIDTIARFGGDEFVVLLDGLASDAEAVSHAERLLRMFAVPHALGDHIVVATSSAGVVTSDDRYQSAYEMIRDADAAMYNAKGEGPGRVAVYDEQMHTTALTRLTIDQDLRRAIEGNQLYLEYQPIVELESGEIAGFEALLQWVHPELGQISPLEFISVAEDNGSIVPIGMWVLHAACAQIREWNLRRPPEKRLTMSVNVSKRQLFERDFCVNTLACVAEHGISPGELKLEITESLIAYDPTAIVPQLNRLRAAGIPIVMDDFGTGVSSLSVLHDCPIDNLKIDRAFIRALHGNRSLIAVVASVTSLAENLGVSTVAEGIEDKDAISVLLAVGCRWGQGYYFSRPVPAERAAELIDELGHRREAA